MHLLHLLKDVLIIAVSLIIAVVVFVFGFWAWIVFEEANKPSSKHWIVAIAKDKRPRNVQ